MILNAHAADGEVIWEPDLERSAETGIGQFAAFLGRQGIDVSAGYDELWQWSVDEPEQFWELFARFAGVELRVAARTADGDLLEKLVEIADRGCIMMNTLRGKLEVRVLIGAAF